MEIKIVKRDMLEKGVAFALYLDDKEHTVATIGELLDKNYEGVCVLLANTVLSMLYEADPRSPTLRAAVQSEQKWATHIKPCEHGYNGLCPECDAMQTPPISNRSDGS